jgi:release factor glutamine methyltransferase
MTVRESWVQTTRQMAQRRIADPALEAEVLLRRTLDVDRAHFFAALDERLAPQQQDMLNQFVRRRAAGEPLAYILGHREFYGLDFSVDPRVLIPRQETEVLVDQVLEFSTSRSEEGLAIADVGTGSGAIAVAIAHYVPGATVYATDSSPQALEVADINRRRHAVSERVVLRQGDLLDALEGPVDIIVSNPPYLTTGEMAGLQPEIRREPPSAIDGGAEGLDIVARLLRQAPSHLRHGGLLVVEIAPQQLERVLHMGMETFPTASVSHVRDLLGLPRALRICLPQ